VGDRRLIVDAGTGDGRAVLRRAAADPAAFVLGLDASAGAMAESSRRTVGAGGRRALPNAAFVVAAAERPPSEIAGCASLVTVHFPWGSLLRGVLGIDEAALRGLVSLLAHGGRLEALVSLTARDASSSRVDPSRLAHADAIAQAWAGTGLDLLDCRPATPEEVAGSGSSWSRRLGRDVRRPVVRLAGRRSGAQDRCDRRAGREVSRPRP
jgi:16S rRNA (adenine(1408)-N(1))-methyltransferase